MVAVWGADVHDIDVGIIVDPLIGIIKLWTLVGTVLFHEFLAFLET